jgi:hypothetical protein
MSQLSRHQGPSRFRFTFGSTLSKGFLVQAGLSKFDSDHCINLVSA